MPVNVEAYVQTDFQRSVTRPASCPNCGLQQALLALGYYSRNLANSQGTVLRISIRRFRCRACAKSVSILPSFAQPYRLILNLTIDAFFSGSLCGRVLFWSPLLKRYWSRFKLLIPEIDRQIGSSLSHSPPHANGPEWWKVLVGKFGCLERMTKLIVERFRLTLFGRYLCHLPREPAPA